MGKDEPHAYNTLSRKSKKLRKRCLGYTVTAAVVRWFASGLLTRTGASQGDFPSDARSACSWGDWKVT